MIAKLFMERSKRFNARCAKYSRYVFNDHFILVLLFLLGFVLVQYSQLLKHFPKKSVGNHSWLACALSVNTFLGEYCDLSRTCGQALPFG